ncbi:MAG: D-aminoacylase [Pyrinomonadaceae bacterium]|nr:D-aminoacylase [Pyrinomonadaceae bacterium]MBP9109883.1 D-aminoacylase [Pyrinomonadaceae bacterium]
MKYTSLALALILLTSVLAPAQARSILFQNASVIDGTGKPAFRGDVRIKDGKIAKIGKVKASKDDELIDASGLVLAPGFIDIHNHSETGLLREGTAGNQVSQGITTLLVGPDGGSPWPLAEYFGKLDGKIAVNVGAFIGHAEVRSQILKEDYKRVATPEEIAAMAKLVEQAMNEGAFGLSSGLEYDVGFMATIEEMIELAKVAAKYKGIYMSHIRDEEEGFRAAMEEAIRIGKDAKLPVQISHIKMGNRNVWGKSAEAIALIEAAKKAGQDVTADAYPYTAWASTITVLVPSRKHEDRGEVEKGLANVGGPDKVLITSHAANRSYEMKNMAEIAASKNISPVDLYIEIVKNGGAGVVCNSMSEDDVKAFYQRPWIMVSSDGGIGSRHPRGTGTFTRVLGKFVRENKWLRLEEAIRKMTAMPAARLGIKDRGLIKKGMSADLVLFDAAKVIDRATFAEPQNVSTGIRATFVNGRRVWNGQSITGETPGMVLRKK